MNKQKKDRGKQMSMIEKVARAIMSARLKATEGKFDPNTFDEKLAKAAIRAMREPNNDMICAVNSDGHTDCGSCGINEIIIGEKYTLMIDKALEQDK